MQIGNIIYLYTLNLEENLAIKQELIKNRFCKIIEVIPVKGGNKEQQYLQFKVQSLFSDNIYTINNYLCSYKFCELKELEKAINNISPLLLDNKLEQINAILQEVKDTINNKSVD